MAGLRRTRKQRRFRFDRNRKRVQKTQDKHKKANIKVNCQTMKKAWDHTKAVKENLTEMGLAFDANQALPSTHSQINLKKKLTQIQKGEVESPQETSSSCSTIGEVASRLEEEAEKAFEEKKGRKFRFTSQQVMWITSMMDKYQDDYKAMARDAKNHFQETPKQIRQKVLKFISIPEHFAPYAKSRGILDVSPQDLD